MFFSRSPSRSRSRSHTLALAHALSLSLALSLSRPHSKCARFPPPSSRPAGRYAPAPQPRSHRPRKLHGPDGRAATGHVRRTHSVLHGAQHRRLHRRCRRCHPDVPQHHHGGGEQARGVGGPAAGEVRRRAVHRLKDGVARAQVSGAG